MIFMGTSLLRKSDVSLILLLFLVIRYFFQEAQRVLSLTKSSTEFLWNVQIFILAGQFSLALPWAIQYVDSGLLCFLWKIFVLQFSILILSYCFIWLFLKKIISKYYRSTDVFGYMYQFCHDWVRVISVPITKIVFILPIR